MRKSPCCWLGRDPDGRPYCEHGPAVKTGPKWQCRLSKQRSNRAYRLTDAGREASRRWNQSEQAKSHKAIHELSRVRVR